MPKEDIIPAPHCLELKEAGYPQEDSRYVWILTHEQWDLVLRYEAPSADNCIAAITTDEANKWTFENGFLTPEECEELSGEGYPQGETLYLWHKDKHNHDKWELYKRNPHDMSHDADKFGFNRWVSAVTHEQAEGFHAKKKAMIEASRPPERNVYSLTFRAGDVESPRRSACIFATSYRDDLINIVESWPNGYLHVTVYFWKVEE